MPHDRLNRLKKQRSTGRFRNRTPSPDALEKRAESARRQYLQSLPPDFDTGASRQGNLGRSPRVTGRRRPYGSLYKGEHRQFRRIPTHRGRMNARRSV